MYFVFHEERKSNMTRKFWAVILAVIAALALCGQAMAAQSVSGAKNADIVFVIDTTFSMQGHIANVRNNLEAFVTHLESNDINGQFSLVEFRDITTESGDTVIHTFGGSTWTSTVQAIKEEIASLEVEGGGDGPETPTDALDKILGWDSFREEALRVIFLLTDANAKGKEDSGKLKNMEELIPSMKAKELRAMVISAPSLEEHYRNLYSQTGGAFIDITASDYYRSMLDMAQWISEEVSTENPLPHALVQAVPDEVLQYVSGDETVLQRIARLANISVDQINVITTQSLDLRLPHEPTEAMRQKADGEFIAKLDTLVLSFDTIPKGESGYFLFQLELPDEVLSMDLKVSDLKIWYATPNEFSSSGVTETFQAAFDPFSYMEITDVLGFKADTLAKKVLVLVFCNAGESLSMWLLKHALMILLGGCSSFTLAHSGVTVLLAVGGAAALAKIFRKR